MIFHDFLYLFYDLLIEGASDTRFTSESESLNQVDSCTSPHEINTWIRLVFAVLAFNLLSSVKRLSLPSIPESEGLSTAESDDGD